MSEEGELRCPMQVVKDEWDENGDVRRLSLGTCGEEVYVQWTEVGSVYRFKDDDPWATGPDTGVWDLRCGLGHVLLVCDVEDRSAAYAPDLARAAFDRLTESPRG